MATKQFRKDIATLKRKGIIPAKVDARKVSQTKHYKSLIRKYSDVIDGSATVVKVKGGSKKVATDLATRRSVSKAQAIAQETGARSRVKAGRIIVEHTGGQKIVYDKQTGSLKQYIIAPDGSHVKGIIKPLGTDFRALQAQGYMFQVLFNRGRHRPIDRRTWTDADEMISDMNNYKEWKDWQQYVLVIKRNK